MTTGARSVDMIGASDSPALDRRRKIRFTALIIWVFFLAGLMGRLTVFQKVHREWDELIYQTLVHQLVLGRGYTLHGSWIIEQGLVDAALYDQPLFFHPPGGVVLFMLFAFPLGHSGYALVQILSYAIFFWSLLALADELRFGRRQWSRIVTAALASFSPIMAHVTTHFWLDGPLLAGSTVAAVLFVRALARDERHLALLAGFVMGLSSLIKPTAFIVAPGLLWLAWSVRRDARAGRFWTMASSMLVIAGLVHLPWVLQQWSVYGSPLVVMHGAGGPGRPNEILTVKNFYVRFMTVIRSPWCYFTLLPRVHGTLVPILVMLPLVWRESRVRKLVLPLGFWIAVIVGLHAGLGFFGYSKLLRYVILATPAMILLFSLLATTLYAKLAGGELRGADRGIAWAVLLFALAGAVLEIGSGVRASLMTTFGYIVPFDGGLIL